MKILYGLLVLSFVTQTMLRPAQPPRMQPARSYSRSTVQIKITNPKLLASLEAARTKVNPTPPPLPARQINKGPAIVSRKTNFYHPEVRSPQTEGRRIRLQFSSNSSDSPTDFQTRPQILANAAADVADGYVTYKTYQTIDTLFSQGSPSTHSRSEIPRHNHDISEEPDED